MKISLLALGSQGDVQPFIALACGLAQHGHQARILAVADYEPLVRSYGVPFSAVGGSAEALMDRELVYSFFDRKGNPLRMAEEFVRAASPYVVKLFEDCWQACRDSDVLIVSSLGIIVGCHIAEKLKIQCHVVHMHPNSPTGLHPHVFFSALPAWAPLHRHYNRLTYKLGAQGMWQFLQGSLNAARREVLDLKPLSAAGYWRLASSNAPLTMYAYSERVAPRPTDWDPDLHVTGYWWLQPPATWTPSPDLCAFLDDGPTPVYIGFGSNLIGRNPTQVTAMIVEALQEAGVRGILYSNWGDLSIAELPAGILKITQTPHAWLFPHMAAVVHHGGAGTTAAALRAGKPSIVVPFFGDQAFWAERVFELGTGPRPIPRKQLDKQRLKQAILSAVGNEGMRGRAAQLGESLRAEDGVQRAVEIFNRYANHSDLGL